MPSAAEGGNARQTLLARRLTLVADIRKLTAETQRLNQMFAGVEMDVLRFELEIGRMGTSEKLVRDLHEAEEIAATIASHRTECEERIVAAEGEVEDVDRALAAIDKR